VCSGSATTNEASERDAYTTQTPPPGSLQAVTRGTVGRMRAMENQAIFVKIVVAACCFADHLRTSNNEPSRIAIVPAEMAI